MLTQPVVIEDFISAEDAAILVQEMENPSERNPYPEYYKTRFGGTGYPYNARVLALQKKYALKANEILQQLNPEEEDPIKTFKCLKNFLLNFFDFF